MKLKAIDGKVSYLMIAGRYTVEAEMPLESAERMCAKGAKVSDRFPDYPICVDDKFFFPGTSTKPKSSRRKPSCDT